MTAIHALSYVALVVLVGWALQCIVQTRRTMLSIAEFAALTIAGGMGTLGMLLMLLSLAGFKPARLVLLIVALAAISVLIALRKRIAIRSPRLVPASVLPAAIAGICLLAITVEALTTPVYLGDAFAIWGLHAREVYTQPLAPIPAEFGDPLWGGGHGRYPLLLPFMVCTCLLMHGGIDPVAEKLVFPLGQLALAGFVYAFARKRLPSFHSAALTAILLALPVMLRWAGSGYADSMLAMFHAASVIYLLEWIGEGRRSSLINAGLFTLFAAMTKNEGMALAIANALLVGWWCMRSHTDRWSAIAVSSGVIVLMLPFLIWAHQLPAFDENYPAQFTPAHIVSSLWKLRMLAQTFASEMFRNPSQNALWLMLLLSSAIGWRARSQTEVRVLWFLLAYQLVAYALTIAVSTWDTASLLGAASDRLILQATPIAALLIAGHGAVRIPVANASHEER